MTDKKGEKPSVASNSQQPTERVLGSKQPSDGVSFSLQPGSKNETVFQTKPSKPKPGN